MSAAVSVCLSVDITTTTDRHSAPFAMHPMPVCSVSIGDIFDCIQRGNIEQCVDFLQNDRSVLKQKGKTDIKNRHRHA